MAMRPTGSDPFENPACGTSACAVASAPRRPEFPSAWRFSPRPPQRGQTTLQHRRLLPLLTLAGAALAAAPSHANVYTVINVNDSGGGSLRKAISDANGHAG